MGILNDYKEFKESTLTKISRPDGYSLAGDDKIKSVEKFESEMTKHFLGPFNTAREKLAKEIDTLQSRLAAAQKSLAQAGAQIAAENFGFNAKKPDEKKKIERAHVMFNKFLSDARRKIDAEMKALAALEKHVVFIKRQQLRHK